MLPKLYFLLEMADHGLIAHERERHGQLVPRYLNMMGRWANSGKRAPLLVWTDRDEAARAATVASAARKKAVTVTTASNSGWVLGKQICLFSDESESALHGYVGG